jgi:Icc-related predicted phosphoesterase
MRILVVADIHGKFELASEILGKIKEKYDILICPGDFTDIFNVPQGFSQENIADMVVQKLLATNKPAFCVPGNHDPFEILEIFNEYDVNLHNKVRVFDGIKFLGWGGAPTPFDTPFEPSEEETVDVLGRLGDKVEKGGFILVTHNPPANTKLDKTLSGSHVGSGAVMKFIQEKQPVLAISAHIHEAGGKDKVGGTTLFYPGPLFDGFYGVVDLEDGKLKSAKINRVRI